VNLLFAGETRCLGGERGMPLAAIIYCSNEMTCLCAENEVNVLTWLNLDACRTEPLIRCTRLSRL
jgi:hypothetical protein